MCGIAGIFHFPPSPGPVPGVVAGMLGRMIARGPDGSGTWADGDVELGHRRLAILDLSEAGRQPMASACGRYVMSFNGEIYNHAELADEAGIARSELRSTCDTEVLVEAWARLGVAVLPRLAGQFAAAVYDRRERCLWLVRDRFGEKPLFHHSRPEGLTFASSISAMLAAPWIRKSLDPDALVEFMALRYVVSPRTVLQGIEKVPPGHLLRVDSTGTSLERWYRLPRPAAVRGGITRDDVEEFDHLLRRATRRARVSDVPVALFLSDGIDSHAIAAAAEDGLPSISYRAHEGSIDADVSYPDRHTFVEVSNDERLAELDPAFAALTEPVGDGVALATWQLVRRAREHATVFLCGHGGDEVLGGYRLNRDLLSMRTLHAVRGMPRGLLQSVFPRMLNRPEPVAEPIRRVRAATRDSMPAAVRYLIHRPLADADLRALFAGSGSVERWGATVDRLYESLGDEGSDLDRIQAVMLPTFLTENLCTFSDSAAMSSSAEIRMPYLDRDLVRFVMTRPPGHRARPLPFRTATKRLLRRWARGRLPEALIRRKKKGFASGRITHLLERDAPGVRSRILDVRDLREAMPGIEGWLSGATPTYRGAREGSHWAVLALAVWYAALDDSSTPPAGRAAPSAAGTTVPRR